MAALEKIYERKPPKAGGSDESASDSNIAMHEQVYERLREALIAGHLSPGRVLSVRGIAAEFDVSAMPAREAIRRLAARGALEFTGTRRVSIARMTEEKLGEIKEARLWLEPTLAERTLLRLQGKARERKRLIRELEKIDASLDAAIHRGDANQYSQFNSEFHFALYRASEANVLLDLVESLWMRVGPFMRVVIGRLGTSCLTDDHHKEVVQAIEDDDPAALREAVRQDILHGMDNIAASDFTAEG
ncbi:MAG: GntR family transcriptional regulator [Pseudomonadota bacterium]